MQARPIAKIPLPPPLIDEARAGKPPKVPFGRAFGVLRLHTDQESPRLAVHDKVHGLLENPPHDFRKLRRDFSGLNQHTPSQRTSTGGGVERPRSHRPPPPHRGATKPPPEIAPSATETAGGNRTKLTCGEPSHKSAETEVPIQVPPPPTLSTIPDTHLKRAGICVRVPLLGHRERPAAITVPALADHSKDRASCSPPRR